MTHKQHKWGEAFEHDDTYWCRCTNCGVWRIHLMSKAYYSPDGVLGHTSRIRPECQQSILNIPTGKEAEANE